MEMDFSNIGQREPVLNQVPDIQVQIFGVTSVQLAGTNTSKL